MDPEQQRVYTDIISRHFLQSQKTGKGGGCHAPGGGGGSGRGREVSDVKGMNKKVIQVYTFVVVCGHIHRQKKWCGLVILPLYKAPLLKAASDTGIYLCTKVYSMRTHTSQKEWCGHVIFFSKKKLKRTHEYM
jgi:hypothetical protein